MKARRNAYEERLALRAKAEEKKKVEAKAAAEEAERVNAMERLAAKREDLER